MRILRIACLLFSLSMLAAPVLGQEASPDLPPEGNQQEVNQFLSRGFQELGEQRYEQALELFEKAWKASDSQSAGAAIGRAQTHALLRQNKAAERQARIATELAKNDRTKSVALLLYGAATYQVLLDYEANGPGEGEEQTPRDQKVRLAAAMTFLKNGLELSEGDPTGARVLLAQTYVHGGLAKKARIVLDEYFEDGGAPEMREQAENLRCLAGGSQAEFKPPPPPDEMVKPVKLSTPHPRYTEEARKKRWEGKALVQAVIDERGDVACARMYKAAPYGLSENALGAVRQWKYEPATHQGKPIKAMLYRSINFKLKDKG